MPPSRKHANISRGRAWLISQSWARWRSRPRALRLTCKNTNGMITSENLMRTKTATAAACTAVEAFPVTSWCSAGDIGAPGVPATAPSSTASPNRGSRKTRCAQPSRLARCPSPAAAGAAALRAGGRSRPGRRGQPAAAEGKVQPCADSAKAAYSSRWAVGQPPSTHAEVPPTAPLHSRLQRAHKAMMPRKLAFRFSPGDGVTLPAG